MEKTIATRPFASAAAIQSPQRFKFIEFTFIWCDCVVQLDKDIVPFGN